ncbi:hypothetical protein JDW22_12620, partial [Kingella sp. Marseille-Q4569]|nr:hypothetical protein [Kingella bonacorsii]
MPHIQSHQIPIFLPIKPINGIFNIDDNGTIKIDHIQANLLQKGSLKIAGDIRTS